MTREGITNLYLTILFPRNSCMGSTNSPYQNETFKSMYLLIMGQMSITRTSYRMDRGRRLPNTTETLESRKIAEQQVCISVTPPQPGVKLGNSKLTGASLQFRLRSH